MEICYIWIQDYRGIIQRQGINFGGKYHFHYNDSKDGLLTVKENPFYQERFFNHSKQQKTPISNITAIVGENGAGKTTLLEFLKEWLTVRRRSYTALIVVYDASRKKHVIIHKRGLPLQIDKLKGFVYEPPKEYKSRDTLGIWNLIFQDTAIVFYSNLFDYRTESDNRLLLNISTNYLLRTDAVKSPNTPMNGVTIHRLCEIKRQVHFLQARRHWMDPDVSEELKHFIYRLPGELTLSFTDPIFDRSVASQSVISIVNEFCNAVTFEGLNAEDPQRFLINIVKILVKVFAAELYPIALGIGINTHLIRQKLYANDNPPLQRILDLVNELLNSLSEAKQISDMQMQTLKKKAETVHRIYSKFKEYIDNGSVRTVFRQLLVRIDLVMNVLDELTSLFQTLSSEQEILSYNWKDLSSGEKAMFHLFARLYELSTGEGSGRRLKRNVIMLMDEPELYFHPQWQKQLISRLVEVLPRLWKECSNIQIVLTSNSPFVVSDLPSSNVIFLQRKSEEEGTYACQIVEQGLDDQQQTFASNIHNLFTHSFFMRNGTMGEFAKEKINHVIHLLVNGSTEELIAQRNSIEKTILIIGEPLIRNKLLTMMKDRKLFFDRQVHDEVQTLKAEMESIKERLKELEGPQP